MIKNITILNSLDSEKSQSGMYTTTNPSERLAPPRITGPNEDPHTSRYATEGFKGVPELGPHFA